MVPLPYEAPSLPLSPFQLVEATPFPVKALEVVVADVVPATGVGLDPFCVVAAFPAALPPALPPPLVLACVGVLLLRLAALVGVPPLSAGVAATPPPLLDPEPESGVAAEPGEVVGPAPGVVAGLAGVVAGLAGVVAGLAGVVAGLAGAAAEDEVALFPLPLPFAIPFALPLLPFPFPLPFPLSLPLPLLARRSTAFATGPSSSGGGAALGTSLHAELLTASTSSSNLSRALSLRGPSGGRRIFAARSPAVGIK